jgi:intein-encoded DNA endonuclease-like protein
MSAMLLLLAWNASALAGPKVMPFQDSEVESGCGCNYQFNEPGKGNNTFLWWLYDSDAKMRIDGTVEKLGVELINGQSKKSGQISIGDAENYVLRNQRVRVRVSNEVVRICKEKDNECEAIGLRTTVYTTTKSGTTKTTGVGACGC